MPDTAVSHTIEVPGARLYYEVRGSGPVLMMIGLPMDSSGFAAVAPLLAGRYTVITYDPRGISRSTIDDAEQDSTPELVADDVHRVLAAWTADPAYMFGSSGGAVTGLALATRHPGQVGTLVAHEPPLAEVLPDGARVRAELDEIYDIYRSEGQGPAWARFLTVAGFQAPVGEAPRQFVEPESSSAQELANRERMLAHCLRPTSCYRPDLSALRAASTRIVVGIGKTSAGQLGHRAAAALARQLGTTLLEFPGGHAGFAGKPEPFAQTMRRALIQAD